MTDALETRIETRRRRKAERPHEILEAAFIEFSRNGYAMTTLDQIAERAGVTKGTIYVYFENKEHLFISMVRELMKVTLDTVQEMFERHDGSTADLLRAQFSFIYQHIVEDRRRREVVRMLIAEALAISGARRSLSRGNPPPLRGIADASDPARRRPRRNSPFSGNRLSAGHHRADRFGRCLDDDVRRTLSARFENVFRRPHRTGAQRAAGEALKRNPTISVRFSGALATRRRRYMAT